jgi:hypothetical protein
MDGVKQSAKNYLTLEVETMATRDMASARKKRALEAKRDTLMERTQKTKQELASVRATLKAMRSQRRRRP